MLYERLNPGMKQIVDSYVARLKVLDWRRRADLLTDAALPFGEDLPPDKAQVAARGFITAVLERLDETEVTDPRQALLYLASLLPEHRALAEKYLDENPEVRAEVEAGL
ncbi:MAG TPA: hypothetical protein VEW48_00685 [Thermoanaerobaculia bacterium]|nr:hypothetical protein [Thermoanaerobaculia bacterium]